MPIADRLSMSNSVSRRGFLRAAGFALTLPWLESLPLAAAEIRQAAAPRRPIARPSASPASIFSNGVEPIHWWAKGRAPRWRSARAWRRCSRIARTWSSSRASINQQAVSHKSAHLGRIPNLLSGALGQHRPERNSRRQNDGPGSGRADRPADRHSQPRPGHRADRAAAGRRPVDDLRLVHLVDERHEARDEGDLSRARRSTCSSATARAGSSTAASSISSPKTPAASSAKSAAATAPSSTNISNRSAASSAGSTPPRKDEPPRRLAADAARSPTCRGPPTSCRKTFPSTCG